MTPSQRELRQAFADAVHDLAAEPTSLNVLRYLQASRDLERQELESSERQPAAA
jgi:hypothetical protein